MQAIMTPAAVLVEITPAVESAAPSDWSRRFDAAQRAYRLRTRKPAVVETRPAVTPADAVQGIGVTLEETFAINAARNEARFAVALRNHPDTPLDILDGLQDAAGKVAALEAAKLILDASPRTALPRVVESFAAELVDATAGRVDACEECKPGQDEPADFSTDERWDEVWTTTEEVEAPKRLTPKELLTPTTIYPLNHPVRRADADDLDRAHEIGFQLGSAGHSYRDVAPASHWTAAECDHFVMGLEAGYGRLMAEYARDMEELAAREAVMDSYDFPLAEVNEMELCEARMVRPLAMA